MENNSNLTLHTKAPRFICQSSIGPIKLTDYIGKWIILFSYNSNFTPVSTTEIVSFSKYNDEFKDRNCELLGISLDNVPSHMAWIKDIENSTGITVSFPLLADSNSEICNMYNMMDSETNEPARNVYFISPEQDICCILKYPNEVGRNISEILRILDALKTCTNEQVETPANWLPNLATIEKCSRSYIDLMDSIKRINSRNNVDMYLNVNDRENSLRRW